VNLILICCASAVCLGLGIWFVRSRSAGAGLPGPAAGNRVAASDIPAILAQLEVSGKEGDFTVFMFDPHDGAAGDGINLQYSIEQGVVGFDWVLIGPRNVADKTRIAEIATILGFQVQEREMNQVRYLRVTGHGIADLGIAIIQDFYRLDPATRVRMIAEGFEWNPGGPVSS